MPALPGDMASRLWHLVRIAGVHNGDRESKDVQRAFESVAAALAQREAETVPLIRLGLAALEACRDGCDYDGGDIQDDALTFGVVSKVDVGEGRYCGEGCRCEEYGADYCYRDTPETVRLRALAAPVTEGGK